LSHLPMAFCDREELPGALVQSCVSKLIYRFTIIDLTLIDK
jgi:hypothetical protein